MTKKILILILILINIEFFACSSNKNIRKNTTDKTKKNNKHSSENLGRTKLLKLKKIKKTTLRKLNKLGVKKMLLSCNGQWDSAPNGKFIFQKNGVLINIYKGKKDLFGYWKVLDNKLFIKPILKGYKIFFYTKVKAVKPGYFHPDYLHLWKYSLQIEIIINRNKSIFFNLAGIKNK